MEQYIIKGGNPLVGEVTIGGAKNAALGILAAAIMSDEDVIIDNLPDVSDINALLQAIASIGADVDRINRNTVKINGKNIRSFCIDDGFIRKIRVHIICLEHFLVSINRQKWLFQAAVTSEVVRLISTLRDFERLGQRLILITV